MELTAGGICGKVQRERLMRNRTNVSQPLTPATIMVALEQVLIAERPRNADAPEFGAGPNRDVHPQKWDERR
ncbi:hypothetical protein FRC00_010588, partial [Tulasnella sp. 408]